MSLVSLVLTKSLWFVAGSDRFNIDGMSIPVLLKWLRAVYACYLKGFLDSPYCSGVALS